MICEICPNGPSEPVACCVSLSCGTLGPKSLEEWRSWEVVERGVERQACLRGEGWGTRRMLDIVKRFYFITHYRICTLHLYGNQKG